MINVYEIFKSIQGESTRAGMPCTFVRLAGCNLRCTWCDTRYACESRGKPFSIEPLITAIAPFGSDYVTITGGEPLMQKETPALCDALLERGYTVGVETNGSYDISALPAGCIRVVDVKCPDSGSFNSFYTQNIEHLGDCDEIKMIVSSRRDFLWALDFVRTHALSQRCPVILSPAFASLQPKYLAAWIIEANAPVRLGLQLHKYIWGPQTRGV